MSKPRNVLLVTNSATDDEILQIIHAIQGANRQGFEIKLHLAHIIPTLPTCYFNIPSMAVIAERYYEEAKQALAYVGEILNVPHGQQWLMTGRIRNETLRLAEKLNAQFILASSICIQDLHKSFLFNTETGAASIQSISHAGNALAI